MNTPAHLIIGAAAFSRHNATAITAAAIFGSLLPDLSLYLLAGHALFIAEVPPNIVFGEMYFSQDWVNVFRIDNSLVLWGLLCALAVWRRWPVMIALTGAALLHIALDLPLHHDDGRPHFWPLSDWVFHSPFSYWDRAHGASWIGPLETLLTLACAVILWVRHTSWWVRAGLILFVAFQLRTAWVWLFVFERS